MGIGEKYNHKWLRGKLSSRQMATNNPFEISSRFGCYFPSLESSLVLWLVLTRRKRQKSSCARLIFTSTFHFHSLGIQPQSEKAMGKITVKLWEARNSKSLPFSVTRLWVHLLHGNLELKHDFFGNIHSF